ncbi:MAG TPA: CHAT domain-containing protein [Pseudonocardiaceae bacterium]|nr:CHAT domain-containing protein [Pseudonocardiaceae bacterium]
MENADRVAALLIEALKRELSPDWARSHGLEPSDAVLTRLHDVLAEIPAVRVALDAVADNLQRYGFPTAAAAKRLTEALRWAPDLVDPDLAAEVAATPPTPPSDLDTPRSVPTLPPGYGTPGSVNQGTGGPPPPPDQQGPQSVSGRPPGHVPSPDHSTAVPYGDADDDTSADEVPDLAAADLHRPDVPNRFLVADLPSRTPLDADVSLVVRIGTTSSGWAASAPLAPLPAGWVTVLVQAPAGLRATGQLEQVLDVPPAGDSAPVRFGFRAVAPGLHRVRVMAFAGGTFLAELELEVSVEPGGPAVRGNAAVAVLDGVHARQGEVTLQVRTDGNRVLFQLLSDSYLFEPVIAEAMAGESPPAVERAIETLRQLAAGRGPYSGATARRWMAETGIGLWEGIVPALVKEQYWQLRDQITSFTIATSNDVIPWELLYPLRPGSDDGFLVEQFPVLRRVFGQQRCDHVMIRPCTYVVSGRSPVNTQQEIDAVTAVLGSAGVVDDLDQLLDLLASGRCGPLHFVCHNSFSSAAGSSIAMRGGPFVPALLNSATVRRSLAAHSPLVFVNACRSAGTAPEYTTMTGWAQQFMAAGAGAFVGTLWPVRSESAGAFAEAFYSLLRAGEPLGGAALRARQAAVPDGPDPTWLAYSVYGDPNAYAY